MTPEMIQSAQEFSKWTDRGLLIAVVMFLIWFLLHDRKKREDHHQKGREMFEQSLKALVEKDQLIHDKMIISFDRNTTALIAAEKSNEKVASALEGTTHMLKKCAELQESTLKRQRQL
jgi:hypothetical protein